MQEDPRHKKRVAILQELFAASFNQKQTLSQQAQQIWQQKNKLDPIIAKTATEWPLEKLNKIDLAILRLATYELLVDKQQPVRVIIDEAVELAKELGGENSSAFVNGVLGTIVKEQNLEE